MENQIPEWAKGLNEEDWQFIKRLLLASGSLKDVAQQYSISYPTIRIKLNRLIEKIEILDSKKSKSKFHQKLQLLVIEGKIDLATAKTLLKTHEEILNNEGKNL
jgi:hypothetical protein